MTVTCHELERTKLGRIMKVSEHVKNLTKKYRLQEQIYYVYEEYDTTHYVVHMFLHEETAFVISKFATLTQARTYLGIDISPKKGKEA